MKLKNIDSIAPRKTTAGILLLAMLVAVLWLLGGGVRQAGAVPANDNFANATVIGSLPFTSTQSLDGGGTELNEPEDCSSDSVTVWYRFTPTVDMQIDADTFGSDTDFDSFIAAWTGNDLASLTAVACGDASQVSFVAQAGVTYQIQTGFYTVTQQGGLGFTFNMNGTALATAPLMNYQGLLTNPGTGAPVADGDYVTTFRIYDAPTGGGLRWQETQTVTVSGGLFNVLLGSSVALTPFVFNESPRYLEVQVAGDPPMTPRQRIASSAYAFQAARADNGVPPGAVMSFNATACPSGWSEFTAARGRVVVGLQPGGTLAANVGSALVNLGTRVITDVPSHSHGVFDPGHDHSEKQPFGSVALDFGSGTQAFRTAAILPTGISVTGIFVESTGVATVDVTMPYLQLLACQKD